MSLGTTLKLLGLFVVALLVSVWMASPLCDVIPHRSQVFVPFFVLVYSHATSNTLARALLLSLSLSLGHWSAVHIATTLYLSHGFFMSSLYSMHYEDGGGFFFSVHWNRFFVPWIDSIRA